jgi:hypothetical protein
MKNCRFARGFAASILISLAPAFVCRASPQPQQFDLQFIEGLAPPVSMSGHSPQPFSGFESFAPLSETPFYDHGNPKPIEQMMLDRINRARANPGAEAIRLGIDLNQGLSPGTIADTPKQPLAMHPLLINASRAHSTWMLDHDTFSHTGVDGSSPHQRMTDAGYVFSGSWSSGENISWGGTSGAVEPVSFTQARHDALFISPGHRVNLMNNTFNEIGVGIEEGVFTQDETHWNALMATQNFALSGATPSPFVLGTVYYDFNSNGLYDPGEEIGGVYITIQDGTFHTFTSDAGGYALPLPVSTGTKTVTFGFDNLDMHAAITNTGSLNIQQDLVLAYEAPLVVGPAFAILGHTQHFTATVVPGATDYRFHREIRYPSPTDNPTDLSRMQASTTGSYTPLTTAVKQSGTHAYHLAHPLGASTEILTYNETFIPGENGSISFWSRLRLATSDQIASVDVSSDSGLGWQVIYQQSDATENTFTLRTVSLSDYAGQQIYLRFRYRFASGSYYPGTGTDRGWIFDNISFSDVTTAETLASHDIAAGDSYPFLPATTNTYWLRVQPLHQENAWPAGEAYAVEIFEPLTYTNWATLHEQAENLDPGTIADAPNADFSGDGIPNLIAYAMGLNPTDQLTTEQRPGLSQEDEDLCYRFWIDHRATDITSLLHVSLDLANWFTPDDPLAPVQVSEEHIGYDLYREQRRLRISQQDAPRLFFRNRFTRP